MVHVWKISPSDPYCFMVGGASMSVAEGRGPEDDLWEIPPPRYQTHSLSRGGGALLAQVVAKAQGQQHYGQTAWKITGDGHQSVIHNPWPYAKLPTSVLAESFSQRPDGNSCWESRPRLAVPRPQRPAKTTTFWTNCPPPPPPFIVGLAALPSGWRLWSLMGVSRMSGIMALGTPLHVRPAEECTPLGAVGRAAPLGRTKPAPFRSQGPRDGRPPR